MAATHKFHRKIALILVLVMIASICNVPQVRSVYAETVPTITISPTTLKPGDVVTVTATNFPANAEMHSVLAWQTAEGYGAFVEQITVNNVLYSYSGQLYRYVNESSIVKTDSTGSLTFSMTLPSDVVAGNNEIRIWTDGFTTDTEAEAGCTFTLDTTQSDPSPVIYSTNPTEAAIGSLVTISGRNFGSVAGAVYLTPAGGSAAAIQTSSWADDSITFLIPEDTPPGFAALSVYNTALDLTSNSVNVNILPRPVITQISPDSGSVEGSTTVVITGQGFTGAYLVKFGETYTSFTVDSDQQITAVSPPGQIGIVDVCVTTPGGTSETSEACKFGYKAVEPPHLKFITQLPGEIMAGTGVTLGEPITVGIYNQDGVLMTHRNDSIQLIPVNPNIPMLAEHNKALYAQAVNGIAEFDSIYLPFVGQGYTMVAKNASHWEVTEAVSTAFNVIPSANHNSGIEVSIQEPLTPTPDLNGSIIKVWNREANSGAADIITVSGSWPLTYRFENLLPSNGYTVSIITPKRDLLAEEHNVILESNSIKNLSLVPMQKASLQVTVKDIGGNPIKGANVYIEDAISNELVRYWITNNEGKTSLKSELPVGATYKVSVKPSEDMPYLMEGAVQNITMEASGNDVVLILNPIDVGTAGLTGTICDAAGNGLSGAAVTASVEVDGRSWRYTATSGTNGEYTINNIYAGTVSVSAARKTHKSDIVEVQLNSGDTLTRNITLNPVIQDIAVKIELRKRYAGEAWQQPVTMTYHEAVRHKLRVKGINEYYTPLYQSESYLYFRGMFEADSLTLEMESGDNRLPNVSKIVSLDGFKIDTNIDLEAFAEVGGRIMDSSTNSGVNAWSGSLYLIQDGAEKWIRDINGYSPDFKLAVPQAGNYLLKVNAYNGSASEVSFSAAFGQVLQLGDILLNNKGRFAGQTGNSSSALQDTSVPGAEVIIKTYYKNSGAETKDTQIVLGIPSGAEIVQGSVILNGAVPSGTSASASAYTIELGNIAAGAQGVVSYKLKLSENYTDKVVTSTAKINYKDINGDTVITEILGTARSNLNQIVLKSLQATKTRQITLTGQAPPNRKIEVYAEGIYLLGAANSTNGGYFQLPVTLPDLGESYTYSISAVSRFNDTVQRSNAIKVNYDANYPVITQIGLGQHGYIGYHFDPRSGEPRRPMSLNPYHPINIEITMDQPERVTEVTAMLMNIGEVTAVKGDDGIFRATFNRGLAAEVPGDLYIGYTPRSLFSDYYSEDGSSIKSYTLPTQEQVRNKIAPALSDFVIGDTSLSTTDAEDTLTGVVTFPQNKSKIEYLISIKKDVGGYMPSATDRALAKKSGMPIFGDKISVVKENGGITITRSFNYFDTLDDANTAMQNDPLPKTAITKVFFGGTSDEVLEGGKEIVDLYAFSQTNGANAVDSWSQMDNVAKVDALYEYLSDQYQNGRLTQEQYEHFKARIDDRYNKILAGQVVSTTADLGSSAIPIPAGGPAIAASAGLGFVNYGGGKLWDFSQEWELDLIYSDIQTQSLKNGIDDVKNEIEKAKEELRRQEEKYKNVHAKANSLMQGYRMSRNWIIDPSGYVYEALPDNRVEGVTTTVMKQNPDTLEWEPWNAEDYEQTNPLQTDSEGRYAWDVPVGKYKVVYQKEGYRVAESEVMEIPPPRFDVNVGIVSEVGAKVHQVTGAIKGASLEVAFDQYVQASSFYNESDSVTVYDSTGVIVQGNISPVNPVIDENGMPIVKAVKFIPTVPLTEGQTYTVKIKKSIRNYNQQVMDSAEEVLTYQVTIPFTASVPTITGVTNAYGNAEGGTTVIIKGSGFTGTTGVKFGNNNAKSFLVDADSQIRAVSPAGSGTVVITVITAGGTSNEDKNFYYKASENAPERFIYSISPERGPANGGTTVTIIGEGFTGTSAVKFGSMAAESFNVVSDTKITAVTPIGLGTARITVTTPYGDILSSGAAYTYLESHAMPVGPAGGILSTLDNLNSLYMPAGAFSAWKIASLEEIDVDTISSLPVNHKIIGKAMKIDFDSGVEPELAATLKIKFSEASVPSGYTKAIFRTEGWKAFATSFVGEQASVEITSGGTYVVVAVPPVRSGTSSGGGASGGVSIDNDGNATISANPVLKPNTFTAVAEIGLNSLNVAQSMASQGKGAVRSIIINVAAVNGATAYELILPQSILLSKEMRKNFVINTGISSVILPENMLFKPLTTTGGRISLVISAAGETGLKEGIKTQIGSRPVVDVSLVADGRVVPWENKGATLTIKIPYKPSKDEIEDRERITVWHIHSDGGITPVISGRYDEAGFVTFETHHLSEFAVVYVKKEFNDLQNYIWAKKEIEVMASKGVINGKQKNIFDPAGKITRADYLLLLVKTLGLKGDFDKNFDDINPDAYYYNEIGIAKALGITMGTGDNKFNPDAYISRQDVIVLTQKTLRTLGILSGESSVEVLKEFGDAEDIADYARQSTAELIGEGLIKGSGGNIHPYSEMSRAEAAVVIYRIYNKQFE